MSSVTTTVAPLRQRRPVLVAGLLLLVHVVVAFVLIEVAPSVALNLGGPTIGRDEPYHLGPALPLAVAGAVVPLLIDAAAIFFVALLARRRTWVVPLIGISASIILCGIAMLFFHTPEPVQGG